MTLAELDMGNTGPREDYGRTPPQDLAAEQSVLGGMLLSKDAIADVIEVLRGNDFYRPAHETVYEAILDLYGRGEPADAVTVSDELTKRGELSRIGGPAYLHTLLVVGARPRRTPATTPRIVRERAVLRRLVEAGTRIVQLGYATDGGDVDEIVERRAGRGLRRHRAAHPRGLPAAAARSSRARSTRSRPRPPRRRADRRPDGLRRPRPADQRAALRPDDRDRGKAGSGQGAGARHPAADPQRLDHHGEVAVGD